MDNPSLDPSGQAYSFRSYRVAEFNNFFNNPLSQKRDSYLKDAYEFIEKIREVSVFAGAFLFSIDVDSLYTNIDTVLGLKAVRQIFHKYPDDTPPDEVLLSLLVVSLTQNDFKFNSSYFLQMHGTAMVKKFAPAYVNIYMGDWEHSVPQAPQDPIIVFQIFR